MLAAAETLQHDWKKSKPKIISFRMSASATVKSVMRLRQSKLSARRRSSRGTRRMKLKKQWRVALTNLQRRMVASTQLDLL